MTYLVWGGSKDAVIEADSAQEAAEKYAKSNPNIPDGKAFVEWMVSDSTDGRRLRSLQEIHVTQEND